MSPDDKSFIDRLDAAGEDAVRINLANGIYGKSSLALVEVWLQGKADRRNEELRAQSDAREERQVNAAEDANSIAREALRFSKWAIFISNVSAIVAVAAIMYARSQ